MIFSFFSRSYLICDKLVRCGRIHWRLSNETASNRAHIFYKPPVDTWKKSSSAISTSSSSSSSAGDAICAMKATTQTARAEPVAAVSLYIYILHVLCVTIGTTNPTYMHATRKKQQSGSKYVWMWDSRCEKWVVVACYDLAFTSNRFINCYFFCLLFVVVSPLHFFVDFDSVFGGNNLFDSQIHMSVRIDKS